MNAKEIIINQKRAELGAELCGLVDNIRSGNVQIEFVHWYGMTNFWDYDTTERICYCVDNGEIAAAIIDCIFVQAGTYRTQPPVKYKRRCEALKELLTMAIKPPASGGVVNGGNTTTIDNFAVPQYLTENKGEEALKTLEATTGYGNKPVLDRSKTPWVVSSMSDWGKAAQIITQKLSVEMRWADWANLIGKKAESLRGAYNKSKNTESQTRISNALNKLK